MQSRGVATILLPSFAGMVSRYTRDLCSRLLVTVLDSGLHFANVYAPNRQCGPVVFSNELDSELIGPTGLILAG